MNTENIPMLRLFPDNLWMVGRDPSGPRSIAKNPTGGRPRDFHYDGIIGLAFSRLLDPISRRCKVTPAYSRLPRWLCEWPDKRTTTGRRIAGERDVQSLNLRRHPEQWSLLVCLEPRCWSRRGRQRSLVSSSWVNSCGYVDTRVRLFPFELKYIRDGIIRSVLII